MPCKASKPEVLSYRAAGVDIDAGNELVRRIQKMNPNIGGFSGMVPFGMTLQRCVISQLPTEQAIGPPRCHAA